MLDLRRLLVFREVARCRSFSAAAEALTYSQPAISHHVSRLELEIGAPLFERNRREGIRLTAAGESLLAHAETLLEQVANAEAELAEILGTNEPRLRLGAFATASGTVVADAIAAFRRVRPEVQLSLADQEPRALLEALVARSVDVAVVNDDPDHPLDIPDNLEVHHVYEDPVLLALPRRHVQSLRRAVHMADLADEDWIEGGGAETPCSLILMGACERAGIRPRVAFNSGDFRVVRRLVAAGVGIALIPELAIDGADPNVVYRPLVEERLYRRVATVVLRDGFRSTDSELMLDLLRDVFDRYVQRRPADTEPVPWRPTEST